MRFCRPTKRNAKDKAYEKHAWKGFERFRPLHNKMDLNSGGWDNQRWRVAIGIARVSGVISS
jgi:hypothetical protein